MAGKKEDAAAPEDETDELEPERIARWLGRHPDFFAGRADLLSEMTFPSRWSGEGVVDFQRYMLDRRQDEIDNLRDCAIEVIETSRSNLSSQTRTHAAALALVAAEDFDDLLGIVTDDLPLLLDVDVVTIGFEAGAQAAPALLSPDIGTLARLHPARDVPVGLLALGSRGDVFHSGQGTELVGFLARVLEFCIRRCRLSRRGA